MAPIMIYLRQNDIPYNFIYTGQHKSSISAMIRDFNVKKPDIVLYDGPDIVSMPKMFLWMTRMLVLSITRRKQIFGDEKKGVVLVHGDTFSTLLGALMGRIAGLKVGHVESGLRSFDLFHPFPEELTRILVFRLSHILYCPGRWAMQNISSLKKVKVDTVFNTMIDTIRFSMKRERSYVHVPGQPFAIVSLHRYENIFRKEKFIQILGRLELISQHMDLIFILHPPTENQLHRFDLFERIDSNPRIECRKRYHHSDFISLLEKAEFIVTDGGSLQEEAAFLGIPCLLMRKATERKEGLGENTVLSCYNSQVISEFVQHYKDYRREPITLTTSPSRIIVKSALQYA